MKLDHVALIVSNMENSLNFYVEFLGLKFKRAFELNEAESLALFNVASPARAIQLIMDEGMLELFDFKRGIDRVDWFSSPPKNGLFHFAIHVEHPLTEFINLAEQEGIPVLSIARGERYIYFIRDPDGVLIEVKE